MKNIKKIISAFFVLCLFANLTYAQSADDIIAKHIKAHGGQKNWDAVKSLKITGKFTAFSTVKDFATTKALPNLYFNDLYLGQHPVKDGYNGKMAWSVDPWIGINTPRRANEAETNVILHKAEFCTPFLNYKKKGYKVKLIAKEKIDGVEVYKIELTKKENYTETWYLNTKTYLEYMSKSKWEDFSRAVSQETFYDKFTKVGKIVLPFYVEREFSSRIRITEIKKVEINPEIDKSIFNVPYSEKIKKLHFLTGKWNVKVERLKRSGFYTSDSTSVSEIKYGINASIIKETILYNAGLPALAKNKFTFNSITKKYRVCTFNDLTSDMKILEGDFENKDLIFSNKSISYNENDEGKHFTKIAYKNITRSGFLLEMYSSKDKGENWQLAIKLTYSRQK